MVYKSNFPDVELPQGSITEFIFANKNKTPEDKPVLIDALDGRFLTYSQLKESVLKFAAGLQDECDFKDNDVLALYAPNQVSFITKMNKFHAPFSYSQFCILQYNYSIPLLGAVAASKVYTYLL